MLYARLARTARVQGGSVLAGMLALIVTPSISSASQFVLFDVTFTYTKVDADTTTPNKSHYYVRGGALNPDRPRDWTSPVDYRNGTVHIRSEVIEKPEGGEPTTWTLCYIPNRGQGNGCGCTGTVLYREKGIYEQDVSMNSWWENKSIVWTEGIKQMDLVIKDNSGGSGHAHKRADAEHFFPTKMRITMIQVSAGATYDPSLVPDLRAGTGVDPCGRLRPDGVVPDRAKLAPQSTEASETYARSGNKEAPRGQIPMQECRRLEAKGSVISLTKAGGKSPCWCVRRIINAGLSRRGVSSVGWLRPVSRARYWRGAPLWTLG